MPVIGWAKPVPVDVRNLRQPRRDFMLVAAAGPASNLVLAIIASVGFAFVLGACAVRQTRRRMASSLRRPCSSGVVALNVMLAVFNMLPIPPLDGGNVLMGLLPPQRPCSSAACVSTGFSFCTRCS